MQLRYPFRLPPPRPALRPGPVLAAVVVGLIVVAAAAVTAAGPAAAAEAGPASGCAGVEIVFARGTAEPPGPGAVGTAFAADAEVALPGPVGVHAVDYAADLAQRSVGPGAVALTRHVLAASAACPGTRFVLAGYSQGAAVVDTAIGIRLSGPPAPAGAVLPDELAPRIAAVAVFGNPLGLSGRSLAAASPRYGPRSIEFCNAGDLICAGVGTGPGLGHGSYPVDGSTRLAAEFVAARLAGASGV